MKKNIFLSIAIVLSVLLLLYAANYYYFGIYLNPKYLSERIGDNQDKYQLAIDSDIYKIRDFIKPIFNYNGFILSAAILSILLMVILGYYKNKSIKSPNQKLNHE